MNEEQAPAQQDQIQAQIDRLDLIKQQLNGHVELFLGAINDIYQIQPDQRQDGYAPNGVEMPNQQQ